MNEEEKPDKSQPSQTGGLAGESWVKVQLSLWLSASSRLCDFWLLLNLAQAVLLLLLLIYLLGRGP